MRFDDNLGIIGLGYVGLPLALEFGKKIRTIGYDIDKSRIEELKKFKDKTLETTSSEIKKSKKLQLTNDINDLKKCKIFIIAVPTPVTKNKKPNLNLIITATKSIAKILKPNSLIIYESTVYPGLTEEICKRVIEKNTNLKYNTDFFLGYSPERINPGDKKHSLKKIYKVVSGSNKYALRITYKLYNKILNKIHKASSIKVAEASKIIENTQRDINIALMNELSQIFKRMKINTDEVLSAAKTKWNFGDYYPGLVGGHCIGVDPYYLTFKSKLLGHIPKIILSGRKINDNMTKYVYSNILKLAKKKKLKNNSKILYLGLTFKKNCPDIRNSKSIELLDMLSKKFNNIEVFDPFINFTSRLKNYKHIMNLSKNKKYNMIIIAVGHDYFVEKKGNLIFKYLKNKPILVDINNSLKIKQTDFSL